VKSQSSRDRGGRRRGRGCRRGRRIEHARDREADEGVAEGVVRHGVVFPEYFANGPDLKRTIRIDTDLLAKAESDENNKSKKEFAEELRKVVATVGKRA